MGLERKGEKEMKWNREGKDTGMEGANLGFSKVKKVHIWGGSGKERPRDAWYAARGQENLPIQ